MSDEKRLSKPTPVIVAVATDVKFSYNFTQNVQEMGPEAARVAIAVAHETYVAPVKVVLRYVGIGWLLLIPVGAAASFFTAFNPYVVTISILTLGAPVSVFASKLIGRITKAIDKGP
jgi:hypothetical protein